jgi:hypothetical protein
MKTKPASIDDHEKWTDKKGAVFHFLPSQSTSPHSGCNCVPLFIPSFTATRETGLACSTGFGPATPPGLTNKPWLEAVCVPALVKQPHTAGGEKHRTVPPGAWRTVSNAMQQFEARTFCLPGLASSMHCSSSPNRFDCELLRSPPPLDETFVGTALRHLAQLSSSPSQGVSLLSSQHLHHD